ncbi:MAG: alkaline phosphatase family protein [Proteobacteria bacterium]|nr:alkaline phosphatase family protein [Pseudomonadota bacterium]
MQVRRRQGLSARVACALVLGAAIAAATPARAEPPPRLIVLLVVDQLRPDRVGPQLEGGLGRLWREGRVYTRAHHDHALTETCPGHAALATGRHPAATGIPANHAIENDERVYCVADPDPATRVLGGGPGRSPRQLRVAGLADWLADQRPGSRRFSVSAKDRAAIVMGGHSPNGAYWLSRETSVGFTTSGYYRDELPDWLLAFNGRDPGRDGFWSRLPERWEHAAVYPGVREDDFSGESREFSRTSGHPLRNGDRDEAAERLYRSPFVDELVLELASELVEREALGRDEVTDLLAVSLSATDTVGHLYGPYSQESADTLARLDASLAKFLRHLEERVGRERLLVALSSDHGVLPLPEYTRARGASADVPICSHGEGRVGLRRLVFGLLWGLHRTHSPFFSWPRGWLVVGGSHVAVRRDLAARYGVDRADVVASAVVRLESHPAIERVWTAEAIATEKTPMARLYRNSFVPGRTGDFVVQAVPGCLLSTFSTGTGHGSPYAYDRRIPLAFWGGRVESGQDAEARSVDVAPTLAELIGLSPPEGLDGAPLFAAEPR